MHPADRPVPLSILSIFNIALGLIDTLFFTYVLVSGIQSAWSNPNFWLILVVVVLNLVASTTLLASGIGLRRGRGWARWACISYASYALIMDIVGCFAGGFALTPGAQGDMEMFTMTSFAGMLGFQLVGRIAGVVVPAIMILLMMLPTTIHHVRTVEAREAESRLAKLR
jgi:hypothetical protein